jgi:Holliday junction resolvasome RuvABC DNA-binding subunit
LDHLLKVHAPGARTALAVMEALAMADFAIPVTVDNARIDPAMTLNP